MSAGTKSQNGDWLALIVNDASGAARENEKAACEAMVIFKSVFPDVEVPEDLTTWDWLFESREHSPLYRSSCKSLGGYVDAECHERLDWNEVKTKSTFLSNCLVQKHGLKPGDTVSLFSGNTVWYPVCMFAVIRAGGLINGASAAYTTDEMKAVKAAMLVGVPETNVLLISGKADGFANIQELIQRGGELPTNPPYQIPAGMTNKDVCGYLNFSSGTTGLPKAVKISHYNVIAQCYQMRPLQVDPENVKILAVMPLFHVTGTWRFCHYPIFLNGEAVMLPSFTMQAMLKSIVDFRIEELILVPPILLRLARDPIISQFDLRHVKRWTSGAAPISPEVLKSLEQRFPWTGFRQGYGATEAAVIAAQPPTHYDWKYGVSVGMLLPNTVAKVVDDTGTELGPGETGEILAKGSQTAMGYLGDHKATADSFDSHGFYHTGDIGYFDEEGLLYIKDRIKEMIKVKGSQVPPAELENLLLGHEMVDDCAVIGIPDEYSGELPKAFVVLKNHVSMTEETGHIILEYVKKHKVRYKWLAEVEFVDKIPKSAAGKLLRRVLRTQQIARGHGMSCNLSPETRVQDAQVLRKFY